MTMKRLFKSSPGSQSRRWRRQKPRRRGTITVRNPSDYADDYGFQLEAAISVVTKGMMVTIEALGIPLLNLSMWAQGLRDGTLPKRVFRELERVAEERERLLHEDGDALVIQELEFEERKLANLLQQAEVSLDLENRSYQTKENADGK
jgi:hypothetical protein